MKFLNDRYSSQVFELLQKHLSFDQQLCKEVYNNFSESYYHPEASDPNHYFEVHPSTLQHFDQTVISGKCNYGIDLPVWFGDGGNRKKILILAMDPLRAETTEENMGLTADLNSPFTIHKKLKNKYLPSILQLSEKYDLYITDVFKLFYREISNQKIVSNQQESFINLPVHVNLLKDEIALFQADIILCLGVHALNGLAQIGDFEPNKSIVSKIKNYNFLGTPTFAIPHASGVASRWAKAFMEEKNVATYSSKTYIMDAMKLIENTALK